MAGAYLGAALGSGCIILTTKVGWQKMFQITSLGGVALAAFFGLMTREPKRGAFNENVEEQEELKTPVNKEKLSLMGNFTKSLKDCMINPVTRYATMGAMFRYFGMFLTDCYLPVFYLKCFP